jgi:hypothetical protein
MENLHIPATSETPEIIWDTTTQIFAIKGVSFPEDSCDFYNPIHQYIKETFKTLKADVRVELALTLFNTASHIHFMEFFYNFETYQQHSKCVVAVKWFYTDEVSLENGQEYSEIFDEISFNFHKV